MKDKEKQPDHEQQEPRPVPAAAPAPPAQEAPDNSAANFLKEQSAETFASTDSRNGEGFKGIPAYQPPPPPPAGSAGTATPGMFSDDEESPSGEPGGDDGAEPASSGYSAEYKEKKVKQVIEAEDKFTAAICGAIAGEADDSIFRSSATQKQDLYVATEPMHDKIVEVVPDGFMFLVTYGEMKWKQIQQTVKLYKANKVNEAARNNEQAPPTKPGSGAASKERTRFKIHTDGYYLDQPKGPYVKRDGSQNHLLEKPTFTDIEKLLEANKGQLENVYNALGMTKEEITRKGVKIPE